jgi:hypothetical protein
MGTKLFDHVTLTLLFDPLIKNFNLGHNFQMVCTRMLIFHMSVSCDKIFLWVPKFLTLWPWPWCLTLLLKTLTLAITFKWYVFGCWYFTRLFLVTRSLHGYQTFWPCDLDLDVWPTYKNFNLGYNFQMVCTRMLIFHTSVPYDKIFSWVQNFLTMWPWHLTYLFKTLTLAITFKWYVLGCWYFTWVFFVTRSFHEYQNCLTLWP